MLLRRKYTHEYWLVIFLSTDAVNTHMMSMWFVYYSISLCHCKLYSFLYSFPSPLFLSTQNNYTLYSIVSKLLASITIIWTQESMGRVSSLIVVKSSGPTCHNYFYQQWLFLPNSGAIAAYLAAQWYMFWIIRD